MKNKKVLNYIYIVIFISVLYIPTISHIFLKDYIKTKNVEKRVLAEKPNLNINNIESYPKQYDDYYNDHIPYRSFIVNNWRNLHYLIFDESLDDRVIIGKNEKNEPWLRKLLLTQTLKEKKSQRISISTSARWNFVNWTGRSLAGFRI